MTALAQLRERLARNRAGEPVGVVAVCSAHPLVLEAAMVRAQKTGALVLIEATCNQVNQDGGYTGIDPAAFHRRIAAQARALRVSPDRIVLGGDHLGPNPWRHLPAAEAMKRAAVMVRDYAAAGFAKLHLDASMPCADDDALSEAVMVVRAARLAAAAEEHAPLYVVGTEVPAPGGAGAAPHRPGVTESSHPPRTLALHRGAFAAAGLRAADRVIAIVVQPGVEFGDAEVADYRPAAAQALSRALPDGVVFEAHSTDYQTEAALAALVADHFAILKVGPELTFALREAVFALDLIDGELGGPARLRTVLERAMLADPQWWKDHYTGDPDGRQLARAFSLSDRARYYLGTPDVARAVEVLLSGPAVPLGLISQYLGAVYPLVREGLVEPTPRALVRARIDVVLGRYARACGG